MLTLNIIQDVLACYFIFFVCYCFFFSFIGRFRSSVSEDLSRAGLGRFAIIIPAYAEDNILENTVQSCLKHNYPSTHFEVVVVGEAQKPATINALQVMGARYLNCHGKKGEAIEKALLQLRPD